jgi:deazaflavin-dependent oxidoreductase (nitroreductase family)
MSGDWQNVDYSLLGDEHVRRYRESDGQIGYEWNGAPTLLLTTTGRRSGEARTTPLIFGRDGDEYLIVGSVGGSPKHPAWYLNLLADPRATVQVKGEHIAVRTRTASPDEKPRLWAIMQDVWPNYDVYQSRTERDIPLVVLTPVDPTVG